MKGSYGQEFWHSLKWGLAGGPTLYGAQKIVAVADIVGNNLTSYKVPTVARTPIVALALAAVAEGLNQLVRDDSGQHNWGDQLTEMILASGLAQTIATAGGDGLGPGVVDQWVNKVLTPVMQIGAPAATTQGYVAAASRGYMMPAASRGYMAPRAASAGYVPGSTGNMRVSNLRSAMRGFVTEHN